MYLRLAADLFHVLAKLIFLHKIWEAKTCEGISGKTQILYCIVFTCRYLDLFVTHFSLYIVLMKISYIIISYVTVFFVYKKFRGQEQHSHDTFKITYLLIFLLVLLIVLPTYDVGYVVESLWLFSQYVEAFVILPQLVVVRKATGDARRTLLNYLTALVLYKSLYVAHWLVRDFDTGFWSGNPPFVSEVCGAVFIVLVCITIYLALKTQKHAEADVFIVKVDEKKCEKPPFVL